MRDGKFVRIKPVAQRLEARSVLVLAWSLVWNRKGPLYFTFVHGEFAVTDPGEGTTVKGCARFGNAGDAKRWERKGKAHEQDERAEVCFHDGHVKVSCPMRR